MMGDARAIEPFGFFTMESLRAGWYLAWRLVVFTLPFTLVPMVVAAVVGAASGLWLLAALVAAGGIVLGVVAAVRITNRVAGAWAMGEYGRPLPAGIWWGVTWRVLLVGIPLSLLLTPLSLVSEDPLFVGGAVDLVLPVVGLLLAALYVVATLQSYGWAMSTAVADRLGAAGLDAELDELDPPVPTRTRVLVPRPPAPSRPGRPAAAPRPRAPEPRAATATRPPAAGVARQCPKCGLRETERGSVIGWYCRICGWRERRA